MFSFFQIGKNNVCSEETVDTVAIENKANNLLRQQVLQNYDRVHYIIDCNSPRSSIYYTTLFIKYNKILEFIALSLNQHYHMQNLLLSYATNNYNIVPLR
jgi:hypothetical protein